MPVSLTTPFDAGDFDLAGTYQEIKIYSISIDVKEGRVSVQYEHGNTVEGEWVPGAKRGKVVIMGEDFISLATGSPNGDNNYDVIKNAIYQYLIDNGMVVGTIS